MKNENALAEAICTSDGKLLVSRDQQITEATIKRIHNFSLTPGLRMPLKMLKKIAGSV